MLDLDIKLDNIIFIFLCLLLGCENERKIKKYDSNSNLYINFYISKDLIEVPQLSGKDGYYSTDSLVQHTLYFSSIKPNFNLFTDRSLIINKNEENKKIFQDNTLKIFQDKTIRKNLLYFNNYIYRYSEKIMGYNFNIRSEHITDSIFLVVDSRFYNKNLDTNICMNMHYKILKTMSISKSK